MMRLGHRSYLFSAVEWKGCSVPLCYLRKTNPALLLCHRAGCPGPVPSLLSSLRSSPCSSLAGSGLAGGKHSVYTRSSCFASTTLFGPSCLPFRGKVSTCGDVYLRSNFFVMWLFSTAENPLTPACAIVSHSVTAVLCDSQVLAQLTPL